jgi:hypothetical protein
MSKKIVYWKQRNGELISIDDMDINHLRNVLKMIIKSSKNYCEYCKYAVDNKYSPHKNMCPNNHINFDSFHLHGNMANQFNDNMQNYEDECDATECDIY